MAKIVCALGIAGGILLLDTCMLLGNATPILYLITLTIAFSTGTREAIRFFAFLCTAATAIPMLLESASQHGATEFVDRSVCIVAIWIVAFALMATRDALAAGCERLRTAVLLTNDLRSEREEARRKTAAMASIMEDIRIERRRLQDETRDRRVAEIKHSRLAAIVQSCGFAVVGHSIDGTITSWNEGATAIYGYDVSEADGKSIQMLFHQDRQHDFEKIVKEMRQGNSIEQMETVFVTKDGTSIDVLLTISLIYGAGGQLLGASKVATNITQKKEMERQLRESELLTRGMLDSLVCFASVCSPSGIVVHANQTSLQIAGICADDVIGKRLEETYWWCYDDDVKARIREAVEMAGRGEPSRFDVTARVGGSERITVDFQVACLRNEDEEITHLVASGFDVTSRVVYQTQLIESMEQARQANLAKSHFLATMSHELRTPLNGILGMAELLSGTALDPRQQNYVSLCRSSGDLLLNLISDVLDFSKIEEGKLTLDSHLFDLEELVQKTVRSFRYRAEEKGLSLRVEYDGCREKMLAGDSVRMQQVLVNLIGNALKFTEEGYIAVHVHCEFASDDLITVTLSVRDTGMGISEDMCASIFDPFTQADASTTRIHGGSGLGLAITQKIVRLMGGEIYVESKLKEGSTFWVEIPFRVASETDSRLFDSAVVVDSSNSCPAAHILVAEDNTTNRIYIADLLTQLGSTCECVEDGAAAISRVNRSRYDFVIMDCRMPGMDGIQATKLIRSQERQRGEMNPMVIVALTANSTKEDRDRCIRAGMNDFISKPVTKNQIVALLKSYGKPVDADRDVVNLGCTESSSESRGDMVPIDTEKLFDRCMESVDFAETLIDELAKNCVEYVRKIDEYRQTDDIQAISETAHALKGAASIVCAPGLMDVARAIEDLGFEPGERPLESLVVELQSEVDRFQAYLPVARKGLRQISSTHR